MQIHVITIFPEFFDSPLQVSIPARAIEKGLVKIHIHNLRDYTTDRHHKTDDIPFGGGAGMVMKPEPWFNAMRGIVPPDTPVILLSPQGERLNQTIVKELVQVPVMTLMCGRYRGIDERVTKVFVTREISVGDYVLSGGEPAALTLIDCLVRLLPGALNDADSAEGDSFMSDLLDYPHYTRPAEFNGMAAPEALLSGHHENIKKWRRQEALKRTWQKRPDLLQTAQLSKADRDYIEQLAHELSET